MFVKMYLNLSKGACPKITIPEEATLHFVARSSILVCEVKKFLPVCAPASGFVFSLPPGKPLVCFLELIIISSETWQIPKLEKQYASQEKK